ncbi:uncharacterized protein LOC122370394 isoform X2 [Amphibalanus amphitrite]|uniref:uncharacterized protein LOC122370394 isoform X2 n=1 Tax=Amphibalanus amphitrite TaxID=1232801 RepID=UPI001C910A6D|nr:uncharacterized protein LOC122370394 isoform X2 [Amphibalanus amphitrite]
MPGQKCCVRNCNGTKDLSAIPGGKIDDTRRKVWLTHCRKNSSLLKQGRVCRKHFSPTQMVEANGKLYLKHDAVPDQNLPGPPSDDDEPRMATKRLRHSSDDDGPPVADGRPGSSEPDATMCDPRTNSPQSAVPRHLVDLSSTPLSVDGKRSSTSKKRALNLTPTSKVRRTKVTSAARNARRVCLSTKGHQELQQVCKSMACTSGTAVRRLCKMMPKAGDSRRQAWLDALGLPSADKTLYVCSMHFVDSDYTPNRFLQPEAVPSKNLGTSPATATSPASSAEPLTPSPAGPSAALDHPATAVTPSPAGPSAALDHPATAVASTLPTPETSATSAAPLVSTPHGHQLRAGKRRWSGSSADERPSEMSTSDGQRERDIQPSTEEETVEESVSDGDVDDSDGDREGGGDCRRLPVRTAVLTEPCLDGLLELARVRCHCGQTCPPTVQRVRMAFNVEWTCSTCGPRWAWTSVSTDLTAHRQVGAARTTR